MAVFDHQNYKEYLTEVLKSLGRGSQKRLAEHIRCQPAYVAQVMKGNAHFSLEQAEEINDFFEHNQTESDYFFCLVQLERAGTDKLRRRFEKERKEILKKSRKLKNRLRKIKVMNSEGLVQFYSSWVYMAVHASFTLPHPSIKKIAKKLQLSENIVIDIVEFLIDKELLIKKGNDYLLTERTPFIDSDNPIVFNHHSNWRHRALRSFEMPDPNDLHYTSLITISKENRKKIKSLLTQSIQEVKDLIRENQTPEVLVNFNIDFYDI